MPPDDTIVEIGPHNAVQRLRALGRLPPDAPADVEVLAGGVSNMVLRVRPGAGRFGEPAAADGRFGHGRDVGREFVVKQSRGQLRTRDDWFSRPDRIFREIDLMKRLAPLLPPGRVPRVLFEDREQYLFGMEAVDASHVVWKADLLAGRADPAVAATMGECLAAIHRQTAEDETLRRQWGDREVFVQLRVDPYYRRIAEVHPEVALPVERLIAEMMGISACVVHADFSPKNILLHAGGPTLVDFETGHFGDPAFDLGFFLTHLALKAVYHSWRRSPWGGVAACREEPLRSPDGLQTRPPGAADESEFTALARVFRDHYVMGMEERRCTGAFALEALEPRAALHLAACMLARIDGKSPVDYLTEPEPREFVRTFCRDVLQRPPRRLDEVFTRLERRLKGLP